MAKRSHASELVATRYELLDRIGAGGVANVYRARDLRLDRIVALKVLRDEYAADPEFVERFQREAQIAAGLSHPNIVSVDDYGPHDGTAFIAMNYVDGETLKERLRRVGRLSPEEAVAVAVRVLSGLAAAHSHGLVHRDVKPHNVLLGWDGSVKLTDFGIARSAASAGLTQTGTAVGTAAYAAPELVSGGLTGPATDVYGAGLLLYEMLVGQPPFEGGTLLELAYRHVHEPPRPPSELVEGVPPALEGLILRALAKDPAARFADAAEMLGQLERLGIGAGSASPRLAATALPSESHDARPAAIGRDAAGGDAAVGTRTMPLLAGARTPASGATTGRLRRWLNRRRSRTFAVPAVLGALALGGLLAAPRLGAGTGPESAATPSTLVIAEAATPAPTATPAPSPVATAATPTDPLSGPLWTVPNDERPAPVPDKRPPDARAGTGQAPAGAPAGPAGAGADEPAGAPAAPSEQPGPAPVAVPPAPPTAPPPASPTPVPLPQGRPPPPAGPAPTLAPTPAPPPPAPTSPPKPIVPQPTPASGASPVSSPVASPSPGQTAPPPNASAPTPVPTRSGAGTPPAAPTRSQGPG